jgi:hypothetical protein
MMDADDYFDKPCEACGVAVTSQPKGETVDTDDVHAKHEAHQVMADIQSPPKDESPQHHRRQTPEEIDDMLTRCRIVTRHRQTGDYGPTFEEREESCHALPGPTGGETTPPFGQGDSWRVNKREDDVDITDTVDIAAERAQHALAIDGWIGREEYLMGVIRNLQSLNDTLNEELQEWEEAEPEEREPQHEAHQVMGDIPAVDFTPSSSMYEAKARSAERQIAEAMGRQLDEQILAAHARYATESELLDLSNQTEEIAALNGNGCPVKECYVDKKDPMVNTPAHYLFGEGDSGIECVDAIRGALSEDEFRGWCKGNAMKYIWRSNHKGTRDQDLRKCAWFSRFASGDDPRG